MSQIISLKVCHIKMLIRQQDYCAGVPKIATIKGHSEMCNFITQHDPEDVLTTGLSTRDVVCVHFSARKGFSENLATRPKGLTTADQV